MNRIYIVDINCISDNNVYEYWYDQMSPERKKKIDSFKPQKNKLLSLAAGILLKKALETEGIYSYEIIEKGAGKPYIKGRSDVFFNLSHSGERAIIAVSDNEIGIDIQKKSHFEPGLVKRVFTESEIMQVEHLGGDMDILYTALWTAKESIMKYYGKGLSMEPLNIELDVRSGSDLFYTKELYLIRKEISDYQVTICTTCAGFKEILITDVFKEKG
ncbi:4'-phosphopantetheinyl transferase [Butyrivibrio proteoclasticus]|uniref:4'-phosphopantetheinyl transferase n=1 Tax=Butyrivibrio proteoclasticus TaxID=43305 RepID=A0A1I5S358_9FIRM|nr:4'-phosphopantetheinyl transferase superfamily protein [Butyrivibrio proteoclasticus]SFP65130.1 4'-phosphopantetheinyl transferase [Butyrivibrio proteoclasticus]